MSLPSVTFRQSPYRNARDARYPIRGVVSHRIVGTLISARGAFGVDPNGTPRKASTHFGIGYDGGRLVIDQFVDLSEMAWGNGDVREPTWPFYQVGVNPNLTSVSIEHEDGGSANGGVVREPIWQASMELQKLITSGDVARIRAAGIRVRDEKTVAQLAAVPKDARGFIDHHQIAGPNKPYCFRRWLNDPGFVEGSPSRRDRLLAYLTAPEEEDVDLSTLVPIVNRKAAIAAGATARSRPAFDPGNYDAYMVATEPNNRYRTAIGWITGSNLTLNNGSVYDARTRWLMTDSDSHGPIFYHERDVSGFVAIEQAAADPDAVTLAVKAATDPLVEKLRLLREAGTAVQQAGERIVQVAS